MAVDITQFLGRLRGQRSDVIRVGREKKSFLPRVRPRRFHTAFSLRQALVRREARRAARKWVGNPALQAKTVWAGMMDDIEFGGEFMVALEAEQAWLTESIRTDQADAAAYNLGWWIASRSAGIASGYWIHGQRSDAAPLYKMLHLFGVNIFSGYSTVDEETVRVGRWEIIDPTGRAAEYLRRKRYGPSAMEAWETLVAITGAAVEIPNPDRQGAAAGMPGWITNKSLQDASFRVQTALMNGENPIVVGPMALFAGIFGM